MKTHLPLPLSLGDDVTAECVAVNDMGRSYNILILRKRIETCFIRKTLHVTEHDDVAVVVDVVFVFVIVIRRVPYCIVHNNPGVILI